MNGTVLQCAQMNEKQPYIAVWIPKSQEIKGNATHRGRSD